MNIPVWPGSSSFFPGDTPFGFYDYDYNFQQDADRVANFCAQRLGYPLVDIELQSINFYTAFEQAITAYGNELYAYKIRDNYLSIEGNSKDTVLNDFLPRPNLGNTIRIAEQYGTEAGSGGNTDWYTGSIPLVSNQQIYDLNQWAEVSASLAAGDSIEVKRVFYEKRPAIARYFDHYAGTGNGIQSLSTPFGFGNYALGIDFLLMPVNYDMQKIQAIELNDQIRRSAYTFELINNKLRIFPIPGDLNQDENIRIEYIKKSERSLAYVSGSSNLVSDVSNAPFINPNYTKINSVGKQWIFEYTLALCKQTLGFIRGKYSQIPVPGDSVTLNQSDLLSQAESDKAALLERLRLYFDETSKKALMERKKDESDYLQKELSNVPLYIYIG
jgi:hypothetical protein